MNEIEKNTNAFYYIKKKSIEEKEKRKNQNQNQEELNQFEKFELFKYYDPELGLNYLTYLIGCTNDEVKYLIEEGYINPMDKILNKQIIIKWFSFLPSQQKIKILQNTNSNIKYGHSYQKVFQILQIYLSYPGSKYILEHYETSIYNQISHRNVTFLYVLTCNNYFDNFEMYPEIFNYLSSINYDFNDCVDVFNDMISEAMIFNYKKFEFVINFLFQNGLTIDKCLNFKTYENKYRLMTNSIDKGFSELNYKFNNKRFANIKESEEIQNNLTMGIQLLYKYGLKYENISEYIKEMPKYQYHKFMAILRIQRAFRKYRYNPRYSFCKRVQNRNIDLIYQKRKIDIIS